MPVVADLYFYVYETEGTENPALVLLHGAGGSHLSWPPELRRLAGYSVYALDLPGHGKSNGPGEQSIAGYARQVSAWMEAVGLARAFLVGHSMGGAIALQMGAAYSHQVKGLALLSTGARLPVNPALLENAASPMNFPTAVESIVHWAFGPKTSPRVKELVAERLAEMRPSVLAGDLVACDTFDMLEQLGEITVPTLVVCGTADKMTPMRNSQFLYSKIAGAELVVVAEAGHMVMLEEAQAVGGALDGFIQAKKMFMH